MSGSSAESQKKNFYGKFAEIFDNDDFLSMLNTNEESTVVLKAHLILEEFLNIWSSMVTSTDDLYAGGFVNFKTKLNIARNLGLSEDIYRTLEKSTIREIATPIAAGIA